MCRIYLYLAFSLVTILSKSFVWAQKLDSKLEKKIQQEIQGFQGDIGIYIKSLKTGKVVSIHADTVFPTASIVKVPILLGIMNKIEKKELDYHQKIYWVDTLNYDPGEDIVAYLKPQTAIELSKVMMLMMTISDNTGSLWLQALAGSGTTINTLMNEWGFVQTKVNSRTPGREEARKIYGWGQSTPKEMAEIFEKIVNRELVSSDACERMLRIMGRQYWDEEALSVIPPTVYVASKNGAVNASRDEVL
ncbi:MAG: hypothetical protein RL131_279, partial [Bacteroidota bacterium]